MLSKLALSPVLIVLSLLAGIGCFASDAQPASAAPAAAAVASGAANPAGAAAKSVTTVDAKISNVVLAAIASKDQAKLRELLADYPEILGAVIDNQPLLVYAIRERNMAAFRLLVSKGADINQTNHMGRTPLMIATLTMRPEFIHELLQNKSVEIYVKDRAGLTAMDYLHQFTEAQALNLQQALGLKESVPELMALAQQAKKLFAQNSGDFLITERQALSWLPEEWQKQLRMQFLGQELWRYLLGFIALIATLLFNALVVGYADALSRKLDEEEVQRGRLHSFFGLSVKAMRRAMRVFSWGFGLYLMFALALPMVVAPFPWLPEVIIAISVALLLYDYIDVFDFYIALWAQKSGYSIENTLVPLVRRILRGLIVLLMVLHLYQIITNNTITTVIAGLGIGGMAVALAATDTLKNFIGFIMILLDRPFVVGERIVFDAHDGVVEYIGLRTTRIRKLDSSQVSIPNAKAVDSVVLNLGRRKGFKRVMNIGLTYDTSADKMEEALAIIRKMQEAPECSSADTPPQVYFTEFKDDNLNVEIIYWIYGDWHSFCRFNQRFNLELMRKFADAGIDMAFPTQTVYLAGDPKRPLTPAVAEKGV